MILSELGVMLSELREEPSGPPALLSIVEFLKVLSACPGLLCLFFFQLLKQLLAAIPLPLTLEGGKSGCPLCWPEGRHRGG